MFTIQDMYNDIYNYSSALIIYLGTASQISRCPYASVSYPSIKYLLSSYGERATFLTVTVCKTCWVLAIF